MSDRIAPTSARPPAPLQWDGNLELTVSGGINGGLTTYTIDEDLNVVQETVVRDRGGDYHTERRSGQIDATAGANLVRYLPAGMGPEDQKASLGDAHVFDDQHFVITAEINGTERVASFDASTASFVQRRLVNEILLEAGEAIRERPNPDMSDLFGW